jgi:putative peptidoglycan lipid II flippase
MLLKAGALSLALLLASRLLGLLRESALAATFGTSGLADVAVLMLTLPDWITGVLASGALAYVLLPAWAVQTPSEVAGSQRRVAGWLVAAGIALGLLLILLRQPAGALLAGGLPLAAREAAGQALIWSALALPAALLAALWTTRLQHQRDFLGMYSAGIVVNLVVLGAIGGAAAAGEGLKAVSWLGAGLVCAALLRVAWLRWRQRLMNDDPLPLRPAPLPRPQVWLWAVLAAGLPLALPFVARSMASHAGEGALATFNYAWKLIELPLLLAIQLVATLSFPAIAKAFEPATADPSSRVTPEMAARNAFALAFALACACAAGLLAGAPALAQLLFGWGRMPAQSLEQIAQWARIGAWGLLPQALIAVALTVLAAQRRMKSAVFAYGLALATLLAVAAAGVSDGATLMTVLNLLLAAIAVGTLGALGRSAWRWLPWRAFSGALGALLVLAGALALLPAPSGVAAGVALAVLYAGLVLAAAWLADGGRRQGRADNSGMHHD